MGTIHALTINPLSLYNSGTETGMISGERLCRHAVL